MNRDAGNFSLGMEDVDEREGAVYDYAQSQISSYIDIGTKTLEELSSQKSMLLVRKSYFFRVQILAVY